MSAPVRRVASALRRPRDARGQALVEFSLVVLLFVITIVALFDVGRAVFTYNAITNGAREGARLAIVNQDVGSIQAKAVTQAGGTVGTADVNVTFIDSASGSPCNGTGGNPVLAIGCSAQVTITAQWRAITPLIGGLIGPMTFTSVTSLPVEFVCGVAGAPITSPGTCPRQP